MSENSNRPPETLRELFGPVVIGTATAMFLLWLPVLCWTLFVVGESLLTGEPGNAAFALVELVPLCVGVALFGAFITGIVAAITGTIRRTRTRSAA